MSYSPTTWTNNVPPPLSAANLNKLTNEIEAQADALGITHALPTWTDGTSPALTDAAPLNEIERVVGLISVQKGLSYTQTNWSAGWTPSRNATRLNNLEQQVYRTSIAAADAYLADSFNSASINTDLWIINDPDTASAHPPRTRATALGYDGWVLDLTVDPTDGFEAGSGSSSRVDLFMSPVSYLVDDAEIWGRVRVMFPSAANSPTPYRPTNGSWNTNHQLHYGDILGLAGPEVEHVWNVVTGGALTSPYGSTSSDANPHLVLVINGGDIGAGQVTRHDFNYPYLLQWDHWYELAYHEVLSPSASIGFVEAWVDGVAFVPLTHTPTLYSSGGVTDIMYPELSNYRWMGQTGGVTWSSTIWYDSISIGPTAASVGLTL